jgi:class 3 adenylate cyclase/tetratricopeptide (TPR) repeat protein
MVCANCGHENSDAARFCEACGAALGVGSGERRKVVSVLFCDVVGSTALGELMDPEALRALLARYFDRMREVVERHGGSVEKFVGDAVMAVFGVPVVHEDDALRTCRAAVEMREAFAGLGIEGRIGVSTGEVVTGTEERLATGDVLNVAARLQQAAQPGEVLIAAATRVLVGGAVDVESVEPLVLKGKSEPLAAFRLLEARAASERRHDTVFVGRERELGLLGEAWGRALAERRCELVTIVGDAGLGKSRLTAEALAPIEARVVRGRCLPYGLGITYWPVVEVVKQLDVLPSDPAAAAAIRSLLGESEAGTSAEEIAWAFRKLLEEQAPLVVLFDDIQWGEETFLDLVEHVALLSSGAPLLVVCMARPELLDRRPSWPVAVRLEPLSGEDAASLIGVAVAEELRSRIAAAAAGNPLFIGEMLAMAGEGGDEVEVPPTLKSLLAARLDQLDAGERRVLERGAVEGEVFHRGAVQALGPEEPQVTPRLAALVRRELIRPDAAQFAGEDGFRFRHLLIRDAAYDALPKSTRAELHERFAGWLGQRGDELVELDEILGYHLEQACSYRAELGPVEDGDQALAREAAERLGRAGRRAFIRSDGPAGVNLVSRAVALLPPEDPLRVELIPNVRVVQGLGGDMVWADRVLTQAVEAAAATGDRQLAAHAFVQRGFLRLFTETEVAPAELIDAAENSIAVFEQLRDELGLARAWRLKAQAHYLARRGGPSVDASERALEHVRLAGDRFEEREIVEWLLVALLLGPAPAAEAAARCERLLAESADHSLLQAEILGALASLVAIQGRTGEADEHIARSRAIMNDVGERIWLVSLWWSFVCLWRGDALAAEHELRPGYDALKKLGETSNFSGFSHALASAGYMQGRYDEAEQFTRESEHSSRPNDVDSHVHWRSTRAKLLARRGELDAAQRLAREALEFASQSDFHLAHADALTDLGEVLDLAGDAEAAAAAVEHAIHFYEQKGNAVSAARARVRLAELHNAAPR